MSETTLDVIKIALVYLAGGATMFALISCAVIYFDTCNPEKEWPTEYGARTSDLNADLEHIEIALSQ